MDRDFGVNQGLVEEMFLRWCGNPAAVSPPWQRFFDALPVDAHPRLSSAGGVAAPTEHVPMPARSPARERGRMDETRRGAGDGAAGDGAGGGGLHSGATDRRRVAFDLHASALFPPGSEHVPVVEPRTGRRQGPEARGRVSFPPDRDLLAATELQGRVSALVNAFRVRGHLFADLDPLASGEPRSSELDLERYGLDHVGPDTLFATGDFAGPPTLPLRELVARLRETYCRSIGVEFTFIEDASARHWLQQRMESTQNRLALGPEEQVRILTKLTDAEVFEHFLHTRYVGAKRFSLEGAESFVPLLDLIVEESAAQGVEEIVIGMAHRGRLNVLANVLGKDVSAIFAEFEDANAEALIGRGDVKYHLGYSTDRAVASGPPVHLTLAFNPSHLEFVAPVVEGRARAKQDRRLDEDRLRVLPVLVHGDAAFAGQGIVAETLNFEGLDGYGTGGTIHIVVNNQLGFTTLPQDSRSTRYCTDITRMLRCPVFHVNGEDPEAVAQVARLATEYRQRYHRDVAIDLFCYRKYGHNEGDEPRFTQPLMYAAIDDKRTVRQMYVERLAETGKITVEQAEAIAQRRRDELEAALAEAHAHDPRPEASALRGVWEGYVGGPYSEGLEVDTAVPLERLSRLAAACHRIPPELRAHKTVARLFDRRASQCLSGEGFDWGTAEVLAYASLVEEGVPVRLSGQDARRGTFSHRHAVIYDMVTGAAHCPLEHLAPDQAPFEVYDSPLSEAGVLGFDYGVSLDTPEALVIWEAQFGDFANGAQVILDQFILSSEDKWHRLSGLVLLLPHGFEGQGPEHSSARLERFLTGCAEDNIQVCNVTTPAQLFHLLRRQVRRRWRKPLVVMSPKSLLRHPMARSTLVELSAGRFERLLPDATVSPGRARRIILCSGKMYYDLMAARDERGAADVALVRVEQLYPIVPEELATVLAPYPDGTDLVWCQEEPWNMGAWCYFATRSPAWIGARLPLRCIAREESASPATGSKASHELEQRRLLDAAFAP